MKNKFCLTAVIQLSPEVRATISSFLDKYRKTSNDLSIYAPENLHLSLVGLIPIKEEMNLKTEEKEILFNIFQSVLQKTTDHISLEFEGVESTGSSLYIRVTSKNGTLNTIRRKIIDEIVTSPLDFDEKHMRSYDLGFSWCTIARFTKQTKDIEEIMDLGKIPFGSFEAKEVDVVITDKSFSKENTKTLFSAQFRQAFP